MLMMMSMVYGTDVPFLVKCDRFFDIVLRFNYKHGINSPLRDFVH